MSKKNISEMLTDLPCLKCDEKAIQWVSRATWKCMKCGKDNSIFYVLVYQALDEDERKIW